MGKRGSDTAGQSPATAKKPALGDEDWPVKARTSVANLLKEVPEAQLAKTLDALAEAVEGGRTRLKRLGGDQELEALVKVARSWVKAATSEESLRALLMQVNCDCGRFRQYQIPRLLLQLSVHKVGRCVSKTRARAHTHTHTHVHTYTNTYKCTNTHTHAHTHT